MAKTAVEAFTEAEEAEKAGKTQLADRRLFLALRLAGFDRHLDEYKVSDAVELAIDNELVDLALAK